MLDRSIWDEDRCHEVRSIDVEPSYTHGHLSNWFSNIIAVHQDGSRERLMTYIPTPEAYELAEKLRKELKQEEAQDGE